MKKKEFLEKAMLAIDGAEKADELVTTITDDNNLVSVGLRRLPGLIGISIIIEGAIEVEEATRRAKEKLARMLWLYKKFSEDNEVALNGKSKSDLEYTRSLVG